MGSSRSNGSPPSIKLEKQLRKLMDGCVLWDVRLISLNEKHVIEDNWLVCYWKWMVKWMIQLLFFYFATSGCTFSKFNLPFLTSVFMWRGKNNISASCIFNIWVFRGVFFNLTLCFFLCVIQLCLLGGLVKKQNSTST